LSDHEDEEDAFSNAANLLQGEDAVRNYSSDEQVVSDTISMIFVGDIMLSRYIGTIMERTSDYKFPFADMVDIIRSANIAFGNLESPISNRGMKTGSKYSFRADPKVVEGLLYAGFDILSIANNHAWDYGRDAFSDTLHHLKDAGIDYVGGGVDFKDAHNGIVREINGTRIAFLAYTDLLPEKLSATNDSIGIAYLDIKQMIKDIESANSISDIVVVSFHWGDEYETTHNEIQEQVAALAIDKGASLIIGHHPHVTQEVGQYKNGWIAYSLGNFIFDQNFSEDTRRGLLLRVTVKNKTIEKVESTGVVFNEYFQPHAISIVK
jgi:poly-gamma-glutamate synthesis protein (capsule biosynthesis protein)